MTQATSRKLKLGWIGLGRMGEAMARRLLQNDCDLSVWNRTRSKAETLVEHGAKLVDRKTDLAICDIVFTMVSTTEDLKEILFATEGLLSTQAKPRMIVDSSSISQDGSAEIRSELAKLGIDYLCAPVSGNAKVANAGKLLVVTSGPKAAHDEAKPYLAMFGHREIWVGEGELARIWKIAHNTMFGTVFQTLCEITVLAEKAGIPRHVFLETINNSVVGSMSTRYKSPTLVNLDFDKVTFTPKLLLKDMDLGLGSGKVHGVPMPAAAAARESIAGLVGRGYDNVDFAVLLAETAKSAGLAIQPENVAVDDGLH